MTSPWSSSAPVASLTAGTGPVTLVEGQTFCLSNAAADVLTGLPTGLFVLDTRVLSRWELLVNGHPLEPLTVSVPEPFTGTFVTRSQTVAGTADASVVVVRTRHVGTGMRERISLRNYGLDPFPVTAELFCDADFADLFEVKESRVRHRGRHVHQIDEGALRFGHQDGGPTHETVVRFSDAATLEPGLATLRRTLRPGEVWELCLEVAVVVDGDELPLRFSCEGRDEVALPARRLADWRARLPTVETDHPGLAAAVHRTGEDLGALRIFDPAHPDTPIVAAGAPWFMTVFGRDSLLTAWMTLVADSSLARGVLETLARFQGTDVDPDTEEEPGKILHEIRFGSATGLALGGGHTYFGSIDSTPLFVMLLGELRRWNPDDELVDALLPHADRALTWIDEYGDRDGDGYVEYQRATPAGLANQGWKDSWDGVRFADGTLPQTPIALCEVQGYVYAAYVARAHFAGEAGDTATFERYSTKARELRRRFNEDFWLDEHGWFAMGLDHAKRPIDSLTSNIGHCLWTGIVDPELAAAVARRLVSDELFSGWGVRTLASSMPAYNPVSYHSGSVWPHDTTICAAGLARYGFREEANRLIEGLLAVAGTTGGRLPELFAGFGRGELDQPAPYPASCSPQAWASAAPLMWLRTMLLLDPWAPRGQVWLAPELPASIGRLHVGGIRVAGATMSVDVDDGVVEVDAPTGLEVIRRPRPPLSATTDPGARPARTNSSEKGTRD